MRIINIILTSQNGGAEQVFIDYSCVLKNYLGHEVLAIVKDDAPYADKLDSLKIPYKKVSNKFGDLDFFASNQIKKIIEEHNADAVFAHVGRAMVLVRRAIKKIKNKKIYQISINHSMNVKRSIGSDIIISVNKEIFYRTVDLGQAPEKSFVVHNAVDLSDAVEIAPKINLQDKETIVLGGLGRLDKFKAFRFSIRAVKLLSEMCPQKKFIFKLGGQGVREQYLRNLTAELNLEDKIQFLTWVKDKKQYFDEIDIFILSSQRETFGLVLLEAIKYRKPIIYTNCDGPREFLRDKIDGLCVDLDPLESTPERIAQAVLTMINNPELVENMRNNSFIRLKERFSLKSVAKALQDIIGSAL